MPTLVNNFKVAYNERRHDNCVGTLTSMQRTTAPLVGQQATPQEHPGSIVIGDKGRYHFEPRHSNAKEWKCTMRLSLLSRAYGAEPLERGKKVLEPPIRPQGSELPHQRSHHIALPDGSESSARRGVESTGLCVGFKSLKHYAPRSRAPEYDMESYMCKKQRVRTIDAMRNGIPVAVPGDRPFKKAEHEPGYYAKGGLVPGSSIQLRGKSTRAERPPVDDDGNPIVTKHVRTEKRPTYAEKQQAAQGAYDLAQVMSLTVPGIRQGKEIPSFEQRTGLFLVKPEDEAY